MKIRSAKIRITVLTGTYEGDIPFNYEWIKFGHNKGGAGFFCKEKLEAKKETFIKLEKISDKTIDGLS